MTSSHHETFVASDHDFSFFDKIPSNEQQKDNCMPYQLPQDSLFSLALVDTNASAFMENGLEEAPCLSFAPNSQWRTSQRSKKRVSVPSFFSIDEYKDLSLKEILDISDDLLEDMDESSTGADEDPLLLTDTEIQASPLPPTPPARLPRPTFDNQALHFSSKLTPAWTSYSEGPPLLTSFQLTNFLEPMPVLSIPQRDLSLSSAHSKVRSRDEWFELTEDDEDDIATVLSAATGCFDLEPDDEDFTESSASSINSSTSMSSVKPDDAATRFRPFQLCEWSVKYEELCEFRKKFGSCLVHHNYKDNLPLARWVKRQRYQYKLMLEGKQSTMTPERVEVLEKVGFVWDSQSAAWYERLSELKDFKKANGHTNVPSSFEQNPRLATWVKCQRRQYRLYEAGKANNMTKLRISELESIGFEWELRYNKKQRTSL